MQLLPDTENMKQNKNSTQQQPHVFTLTFVITVQQMLSISLLMFNLKV